MSASKYDLRPEDIRERLARTALADDPSGVSIDSVNRDWPTGLRAQLTANLKPAGVLIPIIDRPAGLTVLLTRRSVELKHHAGEQEEVYLRYRHPTESPDTLRTRSCSVGSSMLETVLLLIGASAIMPLARGRASHLPDRPLLHQRLVV